MGAKSRGLWAYSHEAPKKRRQDYVYCDRCGSLIFTGDWPFCRPGHSEDHR